MEIILLFLLVVGLCKGFSGVPPKQKKHKRYNRYQRTAYNDASGNSVFDTLFDEGKYGEFLIYSCLEDLGEEHKLLTNVYLPKGNGTTTEIDLIMISATGIYVFESKNYSGWIFGDENSRYWKQIFQRRPAFSILQSYLAEQEAHQRSEAASWSGRRGFSFLYRFQRAVRPQENVCLFAGSEGDEPAINWLAKLLRTWSGGRNFSRLWKSNSFTSN